MQGAARSRDPYQSAADSGGGGRTPEPEKRDESRVTGVETAAAATSRRQGGSAQRRPADYVSPTPGYKSKQMYTA